MKEFYTYLWELITVWPNDRILVTVLVSALWLVLSFIISLNLRKPATYMTISVMTLTLAMVVWPVFVAALVIMFLAWLIGKIREENA